MSSMPRRIAADLGGAYAVLTARFAFTVDGLSPARVAGALVDQGP